MTLDVDVAGLKGMAEFFDKNIELLQVVLGQYAPTALAMAAGNNGNGDAWIDGLDCKLQIGPSEDHVPEVRYATMPGQSQPG